MQSRVVLKLRDWQLWELTWYITPIFSDFRITSFAHKLLIARFNTLLFDTHLVCFMFLFTER